MIRRLALVLLLALGSGAQAAPPVDEVLAALDQVRQVRDGIEALLREHPDIEQESARIRLVGFGLHGVELQFYAYFASPGYAGFLAAREELLLQMAAIVESAGCSFAASPSPPAAG